MLLLLCLEHKLLCCKFVAAGLLRVAARTGETWLL